MTNQRGSNPPLNQITMTTLKIFTIWQTTQFGLGCFKIKAKDFNDAFNRLGKKDKAKLHSWIEDEDGESITFEEIKTN
jgi:hypothetical protein